MPDAAVAVDAATTDSGSAVCSPPAILPTGWQHIDSVSAGEVVATDNSATVDATAGGPPNAADNPYIYLAFTADSIQKVDVTDVEAYEDDSWDVAIKRQVLRINGGDSGPGERELAIVEAAALDEVTAAPEDGMFGADDWVSEECMYVGGLIGEPATAVGTWYGYDEDTNRLTPSEVIYVIRRSDDTAIKLAIKNYYFEDTSGYYEIEWAGL